MTSSARLHVLLLDEGEAASLDALAASVAVFGGDAFELVAAPDCSALWRTAEEFAAADAEAVVVVDVDRHPQPKSILADVVEIGYPVVVVTDGGHDAIEDHALSVGAAAYLPTTMPARELVACLSSLGSPARPAPPGVGGPEPLSW